MIVSCGVVGCTKFLERSVPRSVDGSNNYVNHYSKHHLEEPRSQAEVALHSRNPRNTFFTERKRLAELRAIQAQDDGKQLEKDNIKFRRLLVAFIVKNNLLFRVVEQTATVQLF